jgi:predicted SAM-dependent methyltransferase
VRSLNVGCGNDIRPRSEGWVNMDLLPMPGVDVAHDMMDLPWPFDDASFDLVLAKHVLEHVPHTFPGRKRDGFLLWMEEVHRVLRPDGRFECVVPWYRHDGYWIDPTHTRTVHPSNFFYLTPESHENFYTPARFRVEKLEKAGQGFSILGGRINAWHLQRYLRIRSLPFARGANELHVTLRKLPRDPAWRPPPG